MKRVRRAARTPIVVESRVLPSQQPLERLAAAAERLGRFDPGRVNRVIALAEAYVAAYEGNMTPAEIQWRCDAIQGRPKVVN